MPSFWTALFEGTDSVPLLIQALEEHPDLTGGDLGDGTHALSAWLEGWAQRSHVAYCAELRKVGIRKPGYATAWSWRSPYYSPESTGNLPEESMRLVRVCLERGMSPLQRLRTMPCDALTLAFCWGVPNLFQALVGSLSPAEVHALSHRRMNNDVWKDLQWLMWAAQHSSPVFLSSLLEHGADPQVLTEKGENALFFAKSTPVAQALLRAGVAFEQPSSAGRSVLAHWLSASGLIRFCFGPVEQGGWESGAQLFLGYRRCDSPASHLKVAREFASAFVASGQRLPDMTVVESHKTWPLVTYASRQALSPLGRVSQVLPMVHVAATQGFLAHPTVQTIQGWPDRGWVFLALLHALRSRVVIGEETMPSHEVVDPLIEAGFGVEGPWWAHPGLVHDALVITRKALRGPALREPLALAWGAWFERVCQDWAQGREALGETAVWDCLQGLLLAGVPLAKEVVQGFLKTPLEKGWVAWHLAAHLEAFDFLPGERHQWATRLVEGPIPNGRVLPVEILEKVQALATPPSPLVEARFRELRLEEGLPAVSPSPQRLRF